MNTKVACDKHLKHIQSLLYITLFIHEGKIRKLFIKMKYEKAAVPLRLVLEMVKSIVEAGIDMIAD